MPFRRAESQPKHVNRCFLASYVIYVVRVPYSHVNVNIEFSDGVLTGLELEA